MGPKKGKKSKAELEEEKLAREEEERKARIAEEKKKAEEAEKQRLENLRIQAQQKVFREQELERLNTEYAAYLDDCKGKEQQLLAEEKAESARNEWLKYKDPTDEPDATVDSDMNTFITLTRETSASGVAEAVQLISGIEKVATSVQEVWSDSLARGDLAVQKRALDNLNSLKGMMFEKLDTATIALLRAVDKHLNDRQEFNCEEVGTKLSVGMWGSYSDMRPNRKQWLLEKMGIKFDIAKQVLQQNEKFLFRLTRMPVVTYNLEPYGMAAALDMPAGINTKYVVGDMILFDIVLSPPPAFQLRARKWTMRDRSVLSTSLRRSPYPSSVASKMFITVPDDVVMSDDMRIVVWNEESREWTEDGITEYSYSESTRLVQFYLNTVGLLALVKNRVVDLPYRSWSLGPIVEKKINSLMGGGAVEGVDAAVARLDADMLAQCGIEDRAKDKNSIFPPAHERQARFTVHTQKHEVVIDIVGSKCRLVQPSSKFFADLVGVLLTPGSLLNKLQRKGVNLLPTANDLNNIEGCKPKNSVVEDCVLREIARGASSLEFTSSSWNQTIADNQIGILARESNAYTCPGETFDYECILVEADEASISYQNTPELGLSPGKAGLKYSLVYGNEYGNKKKFSHVPRPDEATHIELIHTLKNRCTPECIERFTSINQRFQKTIYILLSLIKPYSLS